MLPAGLGGLACAACFAIPILVVTGLIGGGTAAVLGRWSEVGAVLLGTIAVLLLVYNRHTANGLTPGDPNGDKPESE